jgi:N-acetylglutamate synthase-like GNAT family acetyltransferase
MKTMKEIWLTNQEDVKLRTDCTPIDWRPFESKEICNGLYILRDMKDTGDDREGAATVMQSGFPVIRDTEFDILFQAQGYNMMLGSGADFNKGNYHAFVVEEVSGGKIVNVILLSMMKKQRNCEYLVIVTHEDYQHKGIGRETLVFVDRYLEECGIEMAFVWAAAEHLGSQKIFKKIGFTARAVVPGFYRIWCGENKYRRTIEVFCQKFYRDAETMATHTIELLPEIKDLIVPW